MAESRSIPWMTIAVEAVAIVASILLAFAIDAWWAQKVDRRIEHEALQALRSDFVDSREQLAYVIRDLTNARASFSRFQSATSEQLVEADADAALMIVRGLYITNTFDPITTTLDALTSDGRLGLISNPDLLSHLSQWTRALSNTADISFELRNSSLRVRRATESHGGPFKRWRRSVDELPVLKNVDGEALAALREDTVFMGKAVSHQYALHVYLYSLRQLEEALNSTIGLLDEVIGQQ